MPSKATIKASSKSPITGAIKFLKLKHHVCNDHMWDDNDRYKDLWILDDGGGKIGNCHWLKDRYAANGNVKQKGVGYVYWFETGIWYYYDEDGKLIKEVDHDKPFKFTFEKVLEFCQKEKIPIVKGADVQKYGYKTYISREISEDSDSCWWSIRWLKKPTTEETIRINGVTGKVESRVESYYGNS